MAKKKVERKSKSLTEVFGLNKILSNETTDALLGLFLIAAAIVLIIAMGSFFATGAADQSILENLRPGEWLNTGKQFTNYCGSIGALLSYYLMTVNFGIPAFLIPVFIIMVGLKLLHAYNVNLWKWFFGMMVVMVWTSVTLAKFLTPIMGSMTFNPGGNHGLFIVEQLENLVGPPGLTAILLLTALTFLTYLTSETIELIRKALNPVAYLTSKIKFNVTNMGDNNADDNHPLTSVDTEENIYGRTEEENDEATVVDLSNDNDDNNAAPAVDSMEPENNSIAVDIEPTATNGEDKKNSPDITVEAAPAVEQGKGNELSIEEILKTPINPLEPFTKYKKPGLELLKKYEENNRPVVDMEEITANKNRIVEVLDSFGVKISRISATVGPTITLYEITPAEGVRINKIRNLEDDIALNLAALGIRIIAPIPGRGTIGIEVPNKKPQIVSMESVLNSKKFKESKMELPVAIGKTISNDVFMFDLHKLPHLLVAGATGQGKSVGLNAIITSLLYKKHPNELKFVLVDPKKVEFSIYNQITSHFMAALPENDDEPIITDVNKVVRTLNSLCKLMDHRYDMLKMAQVKKIEEYNEKFVNHKLDMTKGHEYMPYIVVIIDEFGDLIMTAGKEIELPIARIAQLARAVGIHMVIATQRPTTKIITGNIKANFPGRIAFRVTSVVDSRTILDRKGAEQLVGKGDMLFLAGGDPIRVQCAFIDTPEIENVNDHISGQSGPVAPMELPEPADENGSGDFGGDGSADLKSLDPFFEEAAHAIVISQQGSTSMIQRRFSIGYNRAGRLMDQLESAGIVGAQQGSKPREVLITDENTLNELLARLRG